MNKEELIKVIARHFGVNPHEVRQDKEDYDDEFWVNDQWIEVVSKETAIKNEQDLFGAMEGEDINDYITETNIGMYTYLLGSDYLFRLL